MSRSAAVVLIDPLDAALDAYHPDCPDGGRPWPEFNRTRMRAAIAAYEAAVREEAIAEHDAAEARRPETLRSAAVLP